MPLNIGSTAGGSVTLSSGSTASATTLTLPAVNGTVLTTATTLTVAQGGTGAATLAANNVLLGNGTSALQTVAPGASGNLLTSNGTTWSSSAPVVTGVTSLAAGSGVSVSGSTGAVTVTNTGVTSAAASTGISVSGSTGGVTFTNTGVTSLVAGSGISVSASTGSVTITNTQAVIPSGTAMLFYQSAAPTGWTQYTGVNDRALRVVSGSGGGTGGTTAYSTYFNGSFSVGSTAITEAQMPSHTHGVSDPGHAHSVPVNTGSGGGYQNGLFYEPSAGNGATSNAYTGITINDTGSNGTHTHTIPSLQYADVIICTKN